MLATGQAKKQSEEARRGSRAGGANGPTAPSWISAARGRSTGRSSPPGWRRSPQAGARAPPSGVAACSTNTSGSSVPSRAGNTNIDSGTSACTGLGQQEVDRAARPSARGRCRRGCRRPPPGGSSWRRSPRWAPRRPVGRRTTTSTAGSTRTRRPAGDRPRCPGRPRTRSSTPPPTRRPPRTPLSRRSRHHSSQPSSPKASTRGEQERQAGRRRRRVLDDEQVGVGRVGQVVEARRNGQVVLLEVGLVVVEAHVGVVDRGDAAIWVERAGPRRPRPAPLPRGRRTAPRRGRATGTWSRCRTARRPAGCRW